MLDLDQIRLDLVTASHIIHQQGLVGAFGHISARIPGTDTFLFSTAYEPGAGALGKSPCARRRRQPAFRRGPTQQRILDSRADL